MNKQLVIGAILLLMLFGCSSLQTASDKKQRALDVQSKLESFNFTFEAISAQSMRFNHVNLSTGYTLKVSNDTLQAYLPFYGVAYMNDFNSTEGGIKFCSTRFESKLVQGKRAGSWKMTFKTLDTERIFILYLDLWDNGTAHLIVNDPDKQTIAFEGSID